MSVQAPLENQLIDLLYNTPGNWTRHDLAKRFGVSNKTVADALDLLVERRVVRRNKIKTASGQNAFAYSGQSVREFVNRLGHQFYTAPCPVCGKRRRLKKVGSFYVVWHAECGSITHVRV